MQKNNILNEIGAQIESYYFTEKELQELTKTNPDRKIVTKLPPIFTIFKEKDFLQLPDNTDNFFANFDFENLESALYEQAENFLCGSEGYEFTNPIYNRKLNQNKMIKNNKSYRDLNVQGLPQYIPSDITDLTLGFESRFECGNLYQAFKIKEHDYELFVDNDVNNEKYTNWFFFRVYNIRKNIKYKFTINNLSKSKNLYNKGQKLLVYSCKNQRFYRMGEEIIFYSNFVKKKNNLYCKALSFKMEFSDDYDTIYIMQNYPYTFTRVRSLTSYLIKNCSKQYKIERVNIGRTLCQNNLDVLRITTQNSECKKAVVIGARVHPAETISSWVMERLLIQLLNPQNEIGREIINKYDVHVLPMINIDGVTLGNYRTNLSGFDLNRTYIEPQQDSQPTTYYYKKYIANLKATRDVYFFLDIHCHSKKFNCFIYANPVPIGQQNPYVCLMEQNIDFFSAKDCLYSVSKEKEKSARVVMWKQLQIEHSYTLEMSYAGVNKGVLKNQHHSNPSVNAMAKGILQSLACLQDEECKQQAMLQQQELVKVQLLQEQQQVSQKSIDSLKQQLYFQKLKF